MAHNINEEITQVQIDAKQKKVQEHLGTVFHHLGSGDLNNVRWYLEKVKGHLEDYMDRNAAAFHQAAKDWALMMLYHPRTVLYAVDLTDNKPVRLSVLEVGSRKLTEWFFGDVHPESEFTIHHDVKAEYTKGQKTFKEQWGEIKRYLSDKVGIAYWNDFHKGALLRASGADDVFLASHCLHKQCQFYYGIGYYLSQVETLSRLGISIDRENLDNAGVRLQYLRDILFSLATGQKIFPGTEYAPHYPEMIAPPETPGASTNDFMMDAPGDLDDHPF